MGASCHNDDWDRPATDFSPDRNSVLALAEVNGFGVVAQWLREAWVERLVDDGMGEEAAKAMVRNAMGEDDEACR